ncbi:MAG: hypothetical protein ACJAUL_001293 [Paraglaciecola sp.]
MSTQRLALNTLYLLYGKTGWVEDTAMKVLATFLLIAQFYQGDICTKKVFYSTMEYPHPQRN